MAKQLKFTILPPELCGANIHPFLMQGGKEIMQYTNRIREGGPMDSEVVHKGTATVVQAFLSLDAIDSFHEASWSISDALWGVCILKQAPSGCDSHFGNA